MQRRLPEEGSNPSANCGVRLRFEPVGPASSRVVEDRHDLPCTSVSALDEAIDGSGPDAESAANDAWLSATRQKPAFRKVRGLFLFILPARQSAPGRAHRRAFSAGRCRQGMSGQNRLPFEMLSSAGMMRRLNSTCRPQTFLLRIGTMWSTWCLMPVLAEIAAHSL